MLHRKLGLDAAKTFAERLHNGEPCNGEPCNGEPCHGEPSHGEPCNGELRKGRVQGPGKRRLSKDLRYATFSCIGSACKAWSAKLRTPATATMLRDGAAG